MYYSFIKQEPATGGYTSGNVETRDEIVVKTSPSWDSVLGWKVVRLIMFLNDYGYHWQVHETEAAAKAANRLKREKAQLH